jgi:hypothetical protein
MVRSKMTRMPENRQLDRQADDHVCLRELEPHADQFDNDGQRRQSVGARILALCDR